MSTDEQKRNARLAENIQAGRSPLDAELRQTLRELAEANLDVPGPRALQLLDALDYYEKDEEGTTEPRTWALPEQPEDGTRVHTSDGTLYEHRHMSDWSWCELLREHGPLTEVVETEVEAAAKRLRERLNSPDNYGSEITGDHDGDVVLIHILNGGTL
jgi:hypothetical protein